MIKLATRETHEVSQAQAFHGQLLHLVVQHLQAAVLAKIRLLPSCSP